MILLWYHLYKKQKLSYTKIKDKNKGDFYMVIFSIIGALIGAGFASGQEMYLFFYRFGMWGIWGLILCSFLIGLVIYKTFSIIHNKKITNYQEFLNQIFYNGKTPKNKYLNLSYISNIIVNSFLLITFYIMISGFGAYFEQEFHISKIIGAAILAGISFLILLKDVEGVTKVNSVIVPTLIIVIIIISINNFKNINLTNIKADFNFNWILQSIVYCSYNMILVVPVLVGLKKYIKSRKQIIAISIISSIIVFILAISIFMLLTNINTGFANIEMPAVYVIDNIFPAFRLIYGIVILLSIFTTAISIGISFLKNITKDKKSFPQIVGIMCISSVAISNIGFANLVKMLFPVFGYLGIIQILCIINKKVAD